MNAQPARSAASAKSSKPAFVWEDPFLMEEELGEDERMIRDAARQYCQEKLMPRIKDAFNHEKTDPSIFREMGEMGFLGSTIHGYGCAGVSYVCLWPRSPGRWSGWTPPTARCPFGAVVARHVSDLGLRHRGAAAGSGCPGLRAVNGSAAFGLTEPDAGSDPGGDEARGR
jgi:glutaryl-CoA dehydrogenase